MVACNAIHTLHKSAAVVDVANPEECIPKNGRAIELALSTGGSTKGGGHTCPHGSLQVLLVRFELGALGELQGG